MLASCLVALVSTQVLPPRHSLKDCYTILSYRATLALEIINTVILLWCYRRLKRTSWIEQVTNEQVLENVMPEKYV